MPPRAYFALVYRAVSEILARVTPRTLDVPRGVDVVHRIRVPRAWLECGAALELTLPRHLTCAACEGGGCDSCQRAGAITLRERDELAEIVCMTLPARGKEPDGIARGVVIRIPEQGGFPPASEQLLPRGLLLLRVDPAETADAGVARVLPPATTLARRIALSLHSISARARRAPWLNLWLVVALLGALALLAFRWLRGLG